MKKQKEFTSKMDRLLSNRSIYGYDVSSELVASSNSETHSLPFQSALINHLDKIRDNVKALSCKAKPTLITAKPGDGKTTLIKHCLLHDDIVFVNIIGYRIRSLSVDLLQQFLALLSENKPIILVLEELESLSRKVNETQRYLIEWVKNNDFQKSGIYVILISQSPERFEGQYPPGEWNSLFHFCETFHLTPQFEDYLATVQHKFSQFKCTDDDICDIATNACEANLSIADINCIANGFSMRIAFPQVILPQYNQELETRLTQIFETNY